MARFHWISLFAVLFVIASVLADESSTFSTPGGTAANKPDTCYCYCCRSDATNTGLVRPCDENNLAIHSYPIANPLACTSQACSAADSVICPSPNREPGINRAGCATCPQGIDGKTPPGKGQVVIADFNLNGAGATEPFAITTYATLILAGIVNHFV